MYKLICLDQDGTLWQDGEYHKQVYSETCQEIYGVSAELVPFRNIGGTTHSTLLRLS
jgi:beta-phosphoglucomutase-like phosphatase (HAD superfamily)